MIDRSKRICSPKRSIRSQGSLHGFPAHQTQKTVLPPDHDPLSNKTSLEAWIQKHGTAVLLLTSSNVSQIKKSFWRVFKYFIFLLKTPAVSPWKRILRADRKKIQKKNLFWINRLFSRILDQSLKDEWLSNQQCRYSLFESSGIIWLIGLKSVLLLLRKDFEFCAKNYSENGKRTFFIIQKE